MSDTPETDEAVKASNGQWSFVLKEACQRLERERNKAVEDATNYYAKIGELERERDEAREEAARLDGAYEDATNYYARMIELIDERDEAREKVEQQRKEIVRLNGATNHAGGTPLKIALRERDEARAKYATEATEHMLAVNKLCNERDEARARLELIKPHKNNPVAEYFSSPNTPETDARAYKFNDEDGVHCEAVHADFARRLERERDEAREAIHIAESLIKPQIEREQLTPEARPDNDEQRDLTALLRLLREVRRERDEAREEVARLRESFRCLLNPQCAVEESAK